MGGRCGGRPLDEAVVGPAVEAVLAGWSYSHAAKHWGVSRASIRVRIRARARGGRVPRPVPGRGSLPEAVIAAALAAVAAGTKVEAAAEAAGIGASTLLRHMRLQGVVMLRERKRRPNALTLEEREEVLIGIKDGESDTDIATRLGRHRSTIWREIRDNGGRLAYRPVASQARADANALRPRCRWFEEKPWLWGDVVVLMREDTWSPQAIAHELRKAHPDQPEWWVSHEAIYQAVYLQARGELRKELLACLRSGRVRRQPHGRAHRGGGSKIVGMVNISERPPEVADRAVPGHWEGDLIIGEGGHSAIATLVERTSRYGMLIKLDSKHAEHVAARIAEHVVTLPRHLMRSLTWDQGTEMAEHAALSIEIGAGVFFADPHSPWQRPTNENWNGLARYFLPKGTDLSAHSQEDLDTYARKINGRPRPVLDWQTAAQVLEQLVVAHTA